MTQLKQLAKDYQQLVLLVTSQSLETDPDMMVRLAALDIQVSGIHLTAARSADKPALAAMLALQIRAVTQEIYCLAHCALGYLALLDEIQGTNEPLQIPAEFRRLSQLYLNPQAADETTQDPRQYLVDFLLNHPSELSAAASHSPFTLQGTADSSRSLHGK